jgi:8-amino-7-oxononanoate synthase
MDLDPRLVSAGLSPAPSGTARAGTPTQIAGPQRQPRQRATSAQSFETSFSSLPVYREIKAVRALSIEAGLGYPFYRTHEARAGTTTVIDGRKLINFANYDYLGLNGHPEVSEAHASAARRYGTSVSGSRLTSGERQIHGDLEAMLASVYDAEAGVVLVSGHATAISVIETLLGPKDLLIHDALVHNCVIMAAQVAKCPRRSFKHNDLDDLEAYLAASRHLFDKVLIVTEGLFSMDGDGPDLSKIVQIKERFGAWLMVDEAHALGVLGQTGRGIAEHCGVDPRRVDIWFGTLSKSLVSCGGYVCGSQALIDILKARAPGLVYSVGMPAPVAAASLKALELMLREPWRIETLQANGRYFVSEARKRGFDTGTSWGCGVSPVITGDDATTYVTANRLEEAGVYAFPVVSPGVPEGEGRLRFFISTDHTHAQMDFALDQLGRVFSPR